MTDRRLVAAVAGTVVSVNPEVDTHGRPVTLVIVELDTGGRMPVIIRDPTARRAALDWRPGDRATLAGPLISLSGHIAVEAWRARRWQPGRPPPNPVRLMRQAHPRTTPAPPRPTPPPAA